MTWGFPERMTDAEHHEAWVLSQMRPRCDWAEQFGQALFSQRLREFLRRCETVPGRPSPVRWIPDVIVIKDRQVFLLDAKAGDTWRTTGNHDIEKEALAAAHAWRMAMSADTWFVFSDGRAASVDWLMRYPGRREGPFLGKGSGTPFWLWPRAEMPQWIEPTPPHTGESCSVCDLKKQWAAKAHEHLRTGA